MRAYIGAATSGGEGSPATGVTIADVDGAAITAVGVTADTVENPMYLASSADGRVLYTVHEVDHGQVSAWSVDGDALTPLGTPQATGGRGPCHLSVHPGGRHLLSADYGSGSVAVHPIDHDGSLRPATHVVQFAGTGPDAARQDGPHAHMIVTDERTGHVLAIDLGTDSVHRYTLDTATGQLAEVDTIRLPRGAGPRHLVVSGHRAFVVNELDSTVSVIDLEAGEVESTVSTLPVGDTTASYPSAIRLAPDHRFVYVANRGPDTVAVLAVHGPELRLVQTVSTGGRSPRDLVLSPDGGSLYVANQFSDTVTTFRIDPLSGTLARMGIAAFRTPSPASILFT